MLEFYLFPYQIKVLILFAEALAVIMQTMCPENSSDGRHAAEEARRSGLIDDYVFYDASLDYLISKLDSMS
jgi:hypothetical protein